MALRHSPDKYQLRGNTIVTPAGTTPVSVSELETWLKIPVGDEIPNLTLMLEAATKFVEQELGISTISQTYELTLDNWPESRDIWWDGVVQAPRSILSSGSKTPVVLPVYPLVSVDSLTVDGTSLTVSDYFIVDTKQRPGRLVLKVGAAWPTVSTAANGIVIRYTAGFGATGASVPSDIRLAILTMASFMFEHRGDGCSAAKAFEESGAKDMLKAYKIVKV